MKTKLIKCFSRIDFTVLWVGLYALCILFIRMPTQFFHGYLWAEDGLVFLKDANELGLKSFFKVAAGYIHLIPRLIAYIQALTGNVVGAPYSYMIVATSVSIAASIYLYKVAIQQKWTGESNSKLYASVFALTPFLVPQSGEVFLTITNLQWILATVLPVYLWINIVKADNIGLTTTDIVFKLFWLCLLALTGPFGIFFAAPLVLTLALRKNRKLSKETLILLGAYFFASLVQAAFIYKNPYPIQATLFLTTKELTEFFILKLFFPNEIITGFLTNHHKFFVRTVLVLLSLALFSCKKVRILSVSLVVFAGILWTVGMLRAADPVLHVDFYGYGARYFYLPAVFTAWALLLNSIHAPSVHLRMLAVGFFALILISSGRQFTTKIQPSWEISKISEPDRPLSYKVSVPPGWNFEINPK